MVLKKDVIFTRGRLLRDITKYVYWNTSLKTTSEKVRVLAMEWLEKNPGAIELYLKEPEYILGRCAGASQGRKEDLVLKGE